jgi:hypothetical protein
VYTRPLALVLALALAACSDADMRPNATFDRTAPWLTWGNNEQLILSADSGPTISSVQLINVDYRYPTTWQLMLAVDNPTWAPAAVMMGFEVEFTVQLGVGRSQYTVPPVLFQFSDTQLQPDGIANSRVLTQFEFEKQSPAPAFIAPNVVGSVPAQSIMVQAKIRATASMAAATQIRADVFAFAAPVVHIRPDWFQGEFSEELGGR